MSKHNKLNRSNTMDYYEDPMTPEEENELEDGLRHRLKLPKRGFYDDDMRHLDSLGVYSEKINDLQTLLVASILSNGGELRISEKDCVTSLPSDSITQQPHKL